MPEIVHGGAGAGAVAAAAAVYLALQKGGKGVQQFLCPFFRCTVVLTHFGSAVSEQAQKLGVFPIVVFHGGEIFLCRAELFGEEIFLHGGKGVGSTGGAGAVEAEVIVFSALCDVIALCQQVHEGSGDKPDVTDGGGHFVQLGFHDGFDLCPEIVHSLTGSDLFEGFVDDLREGEGADIGDIRTGAGNDELPAGGNRIVDGVFVGIAQLFKTGNDDIVVGILREA